MSRAAGRLSALLFAGLGAAGLTLLPAAAAHAATDEPIAAEVRFEIGPFNATARDWPITAVQLRGGLLEGKRANVTLEGAGGVTLWEGEVVFTGPVTRLVLDRFVTVGAVVRVSLSQQGFPVAVAPVVKETPAVPAAPASEATPRGAIPPEAIPPEVRAEIITRSLPSAASPSVREVVSRGTASAPRLAVSLVVLLVVFAIVFRLPLFSVGAGAQARSRP
ncbi:MAG: hypothetical protein WD296_07505 [Acidimicrobiia bacterium]